MVAYFIGIAVDPELARRVALNLGLCTTLAGKAGQPIEASGVEISSLQENRRGRFQTCPTKGVETHGHASLRKLGSLQQERLDQPAQDKPKRKKQPHEKMYLYGAGIGWYKLGDFVVISSEDFYRRVS